MAGQSGITLSLNPFNISALGAHQKEYNWLYILAWLFTFAYYCPCKREYVSLETKKQKIQLASLAIFMSILTQLRLKLSNANVLCLPHPHAFHIFEEIIALKDQVFSLPIGRAQIYPQTIVIP